MITVPWMLFVKPFIIKRHMKKNIGSHQNQGEQEIEMRDMRTGSDNMHNYNEFVEEPDDVRY